MSYPNSLGLVASGSGGGVGPVGPAGLGVSSVTTTTNDDGTTSLTLNMTDGSTQGPFSLYAIPSPFNVSGTASIGYLTVEGSLGGTAFKVGDTSGYNCLQVDSSTGQTSSTLMMVQTQTDGVAFQVVGTTNTQVLGVDTLDQLVSANAVYIQPAIDTVAFSVHDASGDNTCLSVQTTTGGSSVKTLNNTLDDGSGNVSFTGTELTLAFHPTTHLSTTDNNNYTSQVSSRISGSTTADSSTSIILDLVLDSSIKNSAFFINMNLVCYGYTASGITWAYGPNNAVGIYYDNNDNLNFMSSASPPTFTMIGSAWPAINWQLGTDGNLQLAVTDNSTMQIYYNGYYTYFGTAVPPAAK